MGSFYKNLNVSTLDLEYLYFLAKNNMIKKSTTILIEFKLYSKWIINSKSTSHRRFLVLLYLMLVLIGKLYMKHEHPLNFNLKAVALYKNNFE